MLRYKKESNNMDIAHIGEAVLSQKASDVTDVTDTDIQVLIDKMFLTMRTEKGVGLAAPQVNVSKRIVVIEAEDQRLALINPQITYRSEERILFTEGCLSVPGKELPIIRYQKITVDYLDRYGVERSLTANEFLAVICQHEIDHINGILMTDRYKQQTNIRETLNIT